MSLKSLKRCLKSLKSCDTMRTVAVVSNILKPFKPASLPISMGLRQGFWVKWLFYCLRAAVPLTIASTYMGGEGENIGQRITPLITLPNCVRGIGQDRGTW